MNLPLQPQNVLIQITYLVSSILFIIGIKMMNKTKDARNGNFLSAVGMLLAIAATLLQVQLVTFTEILICLALGSVIGLYYASKVEMTKIPEMVALFNGFGGLASVAVALSDYFKQVNNPEFAGLDTVSLVSIIVSILIGAVTFTGSMVAYLKLDGKISGSPVTFKGDRKSTRLNSSH